METKIDQIRAALDQIARDFPRYADTVARQKARAAGKPPREAEDALRTSLYLYWADGDRPEALRRQALAANQRIEPGKWDGTIEQHDAEAADGLAQMEVREAARARKV